MLLDHKKWGVAACVFLFSMGLLSGCGKEEAAYSVKIEDCNVETQLEVPENQTVKDVLAEAEISLGEQDTVTPALTDTVTADTEITVKRHAAVTLTADKKEYHVEITGGKVEDALKQANITLSKKDIVNHEEQAYLTDGMNIDVVRILSVFFTADGKTEEITTSASTVKEFLESEGIKVKKRDRLSMKKSDKLEDGAKLTLKRVTFGKETVTESIPYSTTVRSDSSMNKGTTRVEQSGENGEKEVTYRITYVDGKEESREEISSKVVKEPVDRIVRSGTKAEKTIVRKWKEVDCDGTIIWHYEYSDGSTKTEIR